jgi:hypothetical protein
MAKTWVEDHEIPWLIDFLDGQQELFLGRFFQILKNN